MIPDCVTVRLKTTQNVPQERKPESVGFLKNQFPVQLVGERDCAVCARAAKILKHSRSKVNNRSQYPMAALTSDFSFVRLSLEDKCYPQNPKVIPTSTFLRLLLPSGVTNNYNSFLPFRCPASSTVCLPFAIVGNHAAEHPGFHGGVVSLSGHRNEGEPFPHTGVDPPAPISWQSGALSHTGRYKCAGSGPHPENAWHSAATHVLAEHCHAGLSPK